MARYDVIILGAGGAGLMCAATASQLGARVLVIDHADKPGKKILISGGGRCNFTNTGCAPDRFLCENPHFAKSALSRYTALDFIDLVDRHGIAWHEKTLGQLFCDGSARQIVAMLMDECAKGGADVRLARQIGEIAHRDGFYHLGDDSARALVIATGGPSIPKMGATGIAYDIAKRFGLPIIPPRPALVPLTLDDPAFTALSGVATPAIATTGKTSFREAALLTHRGLSGPAILQISSYWQDGEDVLLDVLPDDGPDWLIAQKNAAPRAHLKSALAAKLPARLADLLAEQINASAQMGNIPDRTLIDICARLKSWRFTPTGTEGYAKAEVTAGGVDTAALSSKTMEAKGVKGLYVIGEAVDVTGWLGGYNFQWAWSSAVAAGQAIAYA
jgi:predicted Rossmann fold flavoprotein